MSNPGPPLSVAPPPASIPIAKLAYTIPEVCAATGLGRTSVYDEINAGRLRAKKRGSTTIILADDLAGYLRALPDFMEETKQ